MTLQEKRELLYKNFDKQYQILIKDTIHALSAVYEDNFYTRKLENAIIDDMEYMLNIPNNYSIKSWDLKDGNFKINLNKKEI